MSINLFGKLAIMVTVLTIAGGSQAQAKAPIELENRITQSYNVLNGMLRSPDGGIPADLLKHTGAIIIYPSVLKAGFGLGGHYGKGIIMRRKPPHKKWGPPVFVSLAGGSIGWQIGVEDAEIVLLVMENVSLQSLFQDKFTLGADAAIAVGPVGRDASAAANIDMSSGILSYSRAQGLFAGATIKGSYLEVDWTANESYYGSTGSLDTIFKEGKSKISPAAARLIQLLNRY